MCILNILINIRFLIFNIKVVTLQLEYDNSGPFRCPTNSDHGYDNHGQYLLPTKKDRFVCHIVRENVTIL